MRLLALFFGVVAATLAVPSSAQLRAGAAKVAITPPADAYPISFEREKPFVGARDDVFARALVLENNGRRVAIVSVEVTEIPEAAATLKAVADAAGLPVADVMLTASHTHNVPLAFLHGDMTPLRRREIDRVRHGAMRAVRDAVAALQPARSAFKRGEAFVNVNNGEATGYKGWFDAKGFSDKSLDVLRVETAQGKPLALMLNYATHAEVMFRSVTKDGGYEVTGDLPGATSRILEASEKGAPVVLFTAAAEGDQLSIFKSLQSAAELPASDEGAGGWSLQNLLARRLAVAAIRAIDAMPAPTATARLATASGVATCPGQRFNVERPSSKVLGIADTGPVEIPVQLMRIGDVTLAGVAGDVASEIGSKIKGATGSPNTTVVTMLAGSIGYILTDAAYPGRGHGVLGSKIKPGCAATELPRAIIALTKVAK